MFWKLEKLGIVTHSDLKDLFDPLPDDAVVFVCTCIEHAIREYDSGHFSQSCFEGRIVNGIVISMI